MEGWGAHLSVHTASGLWNMTQSSWHINALELEAVFLGLQSFLSLVTDKHVRVRTDNTTVAAYINRQGGSRSLTLSGKACQILIWCSQHRILLSAKYLPGSLNVLADSLSRSSSVIHTEWTLTHQALQRLWLRVNKPMVDLFATRFSRRLPVFVSPFPDPEAWKVNALEIDWSGLMAYVFPAVQTLEQGSEEGGHRTALPGVGSPLVAQPTIVSRSSLSRGRSSHSSRRQKGRTGSAKIGSTSREPPIAEASRVDTVMVALRRSGASDSTLEFVQKAHRVSTGSVYSSHWSAWVKWCSGNGVNPTSPRSMQVANHLSWLAAQGISPSSLR
ncbi:hypothetical protein V1264_010130 [Littorina saxatilis]|uniref:Uncharacterized protein n=1 Tax=Littorina saxatilis TaxID=31220 RepID=A0AAN9ANT3_9CAEN